MNGVGRKTPPSLSSNKNHNLETTLRLEFYLMISFLLKKHFLERVFFILLTLVLLLLLTHYIKNQESNHSWTQIVCCRLISSYHCMICFPFALLLYRIHHSPAIRIYFISHIHTSISIAPLFSCYHVV